jgi:hypothetical protein
MNFVFEMSGTLGAGMRSIVYFMVAFGLIWVGVLESATSSVDDFPHRPDGGDVEHQGSVERILAVGLVGNLVVKSIITNGRRTVIAEGHETFSESNQVLSRSVEGSD